MTLDKKPLKEAVDLWGDKQIDVLIEEMAELTQALCKRKRNRATNIPEEIADVYIMLEQVVMLLGIERELELEIGVKMRMLTHKIKIEKEKNSDNQNP